MKKDTIYIDIEDDITAIIDKVKSSSSKVVAVIPPKRADVLQSVVNLKLLQRSTKTAKKSLVLVTNDRALSSLAGGIGVHVAKDLHSKPEIPTAPDLDEVELETTEEPEVVGAVTTDKVEKQPEKTSKAKKSKKEKKAKAKAAKSDAPKEKRLKIPNFDRFRNKILLGTGGLILLAVGWWLAFFVLPTATVSIKAQTSRLRTNQEITVDAKATATDIENFTVKAVTQSISKPVSEKAAATGEKNNGQKASGTVTIQNCDDSDSFTIPAGTGFSANGVTFISSNDVVVPGASFSGGVCDAAGVNDVAVVAQEAGDEFNLTSGTTYDIANQSSLVSGVGSQMTGGTTEVVEIVSQEDVNTALAKIQPQNESEIKKELAALFKEDELVIGESYDVVAGEPQIAPAVGTEATETTVTISYTYTVQGVSKADVEAVLAANQNAQFDETKQTIFDNGVGSVRLDVTSTAGDALEVTVLADAFIGPKIETEALAETLTGKRFSDLVETVKEVPGVNEVDVEFSPFWVFSAPRSADKITIELDVADQTLE